MIPTPWKGIMSVLYIHLLFTKYPIGCLLPLNELLFHSSCHQRISAHLFHTISTLTLLKNGQLKTFLHHCEWIDNQDILQPLNIQRNTNAPLFHIFLFKYLQVLSSKSMQSISLSCCASSMLTNLSIFIPKKRSDTKI